MNINKCIINTIMGMAIFTGSAFAAEDDKWFVRSHFGFSQAGDQSPKANNVGAGISSAEAEVDGGFVSGIGVGYRINEKWATELGWEYRTNDAEVTLDNGEKFTDGNYASNTFYLNGIYSLQNKGKWKPYLGAGLVWVQEIDIDLEEGDFERSFSDSGEIGYQIFAGVTRPINNKWSIQGELRYGSISSIDLSEETGDGQLTGLDYKPLTLQIGVQYNF